LIQGYKLRDLGRFINLVLHFVKVVCSEIINRAEHICVILKLSLSPF